MTNPIPQFIVPVFGGQGATSIDSPQVLERARRDASSSSGAFLLSACHEALHMELASLRPEELALTKMVIADFKTPDALLAVTQNQYSRNPIISGTRLFVVQALRYLAFAEWSHSQAEHRPSFDDILKDNANSGIGVLGFSSGILPACVVAASSSTIQFITNAVQGYRLAFWIGLRAQEHRSRTLQERGLPDDCSLPWSAVFRGISKTSAEERIAASPIKVSLPFLLDAPVQTFNMRQDGFLCVTATLGDDCVTISGFPDCIEVSSDILMSDSLVHTPTTINALYHSHLHDQTRTLVLADIQRRKIRFPDFRDLNIPVRSSRTGRTIDALTSSGSLIENVVDMLLLHPVNWDIVTRQIWDCRKTPICFVNVGPGTGLAHNMAKGFPSGDVSILDLASADTPLPGILREPFQQESSIAIVGMAVNVPGARNTSELWDLLEAGMNTITEVTTLLHVFELILILFITSQIPQRRFRASDYCDSGVSRPGRSMKARKGNFIENLDEFDNDFFQISPREAKNMDPQQRLLLHTAYEALEDAGYVPNATPSFQQATFGCYIGVATHDYAQNLKDSIDVYYNTGKRARSPFTSIYDS